MPQTDTPLKLLLREFAPDFAAWLLDVSEAEVHRVQPLNIELPVGAVRSDTVFRVTLADGRVTLLHVEFQGRRSESPMPLRMLDYISRLAQRESGYLCSAVLYVGDGAGANDEGTHEIDCPNGAPTLAWCYRVIRLWQMQADDLLALGRPALLALIGQTRIEEPERVLPQVMDTIGQTSDEEKRIRLLAALTSLMRDEEVLEMAEQMIRAIDRDLMLDTPFLRRIRERERAEGRTEGRTEGRIEGRAEGQIEGQIEELTEAILEVLTARLDISMRTYRRLERRLSTVAGDSIGTDRERLAAEVLERLRGLLRAAVLVTDVAGFEQALESLDELTEGD